MRWTIENQRTKFIQKQQFPIFDGTQEYCLWLGCMVGDHLEGREIYHLVRAGHEPSL